MPKKTYKIEISGIVQGVGFRPFIYRLANDLAITGYVANSSAGVLILAQGTVRALTDFLMAIPKEKPAIALIEKLSQSEVDSVVFADFRIVQSTLSSNNDIYISPDLSTCNHCAEDIIDPINRRYLYPFTTCTYCGPRYSIIEDIPYDRDKTTMHKFAMCPACQAEYDNPADRRYHSQPNACEVCGPKLTLIRGEDGLLQTENPISETILLLKAGAIVAVKGLGGFLLCCDAHNNEAALELRKRKHRDAKPFAVMVKDIATTGNYCTVSAAEIELLTSPQNPIVLLDKRTGCTIAHGVAPDNNRLGVMLPYTPVHILLMQEVPALVMTSANLTDAPIIADNDAAIVGLESIADYILLHDRRIANRIDDSVCQVVNGLPQAIRRARGYVPGIIKAPGLSRTILAVGGELKNVFAVNRGETIFVGSHVGDLKNLETYDFFKESISEYLRKFGLTPRLVACDKHPEYLSGTWAKQNYLNIPIVEVGHHHAHLVSCMVEHGLSGRVIGIAMDGTGYGDDGNIWGCECGIVSYQQFDRRSHLDYFSLPGGDKCAAQVYRSALSLLYHTYGELDFDKYSFLAGLPRHELQILQEMIKKRINSPLTSSMGRFFDGVSALIGLGNNSVYEASAAICLEAIADRTEQSAYPVIILDKTNGYVWDQRDIIDGIVEDIGKGVAPSIISARFHNSVVNYIKLTAVMLRAQTGINQIVLSGGVFLNALISTRTEQVLKRNGFDVFLQRKFPPGDGGLAIGQLVIANEVS